MQDKMAQSISQLALLLAWDNEIMKLISWNCKMAYRKKAEHILRYHPDLVVVPECEQFKESPKTLWFGDNPKKGIGIFTYSDFKLELHRPKNKGEIITHISPFIA